MKILSVVGARPQFVKASIVSQALLLDGHEEFLVHTGQHYDEKMSNIFFEELGIPRPHVNLNVGSASHAAQTAAMLCGLEEHMQKIRPDWVLVYGDTNSTLAGALAAAKINLPVAHVEAGLRSFNRKMPEEINRIVTDTLSDLLMAPSQAAVSNLENEGISSQKVHMVGDVMYDAALFYAGLASKKSSILQDKNLLPKQYILVTVHRAENTDSRHQMESIIRSLCSLASHHKIVFPVHPRTRAAMEHYGLYDQAQKKLQIIDPVGYLDMLRLEENSLLIVTDSGGVQKEAFFYKVPCITLRSETEWPELLEMGWNKLCHPVCSEEIVNSVNTSIGKLGKDGSPYGTGNAAKKISKCLVDSRLPG